MITTITIGMAIDKEVGKKKIEKFQTITRHCFQKFDFSLCAAGGTFEIVASSEYYEGDEGEREKEMTEDLMVIFAGAI